MVGALVAHAAYGWQPACGRAPAVRLGVQTSVVAGPAADLYVQAPPRWLGAGAIGIGLLSEGGAGHGRRQMPYVQAGIANGRGLGANLVLGRYAVRGEASTYTDDERATVGWLSTELPIGTLVTTHVHYGFAKGHVRRRSLRSRDEFVDEDRWSHLGGVTFEMHRARR